MFCFKRKLPQHRPPCTPFPGNISDFIESGTSTLNTNDNFLSFSRLQQCISEHVEIGVIQHRKSQVDLLYLGRDGQCACHLTEHFSTLKLAETNLTLQSTLARWNLHLFINYNAQARFTLWKAVQTPVCHITRSWWTWSSQANICDTILFRKI